MRKSLLSTAAIFVALHSSAFAGTCHNQSVPEGTICSIPIVVSQQCQGGLAGQPEVAIEVANPEPSPVMIEGATASIVVSNSDGPFAAMVGDSDSPDPVVSDQYSSTLINGNWFLTETNTFPAGFGMQWLPGNLARHHVDLHVQCVPPASFVAMLTIYYYAPEGGIREE